MRLVKITAILIAVMGINAIYLTTVNAWGQWGDEGGGSSQSGLYGCTHNGAFFDEVTASNGSAALTACVNSHSTIPPGAEHHPGMTAGIDPESYKKGGGVRVVHHHTDSPDQRPKGAGNRATHNLPHCIVKKEGLFM